MGRQTNKAYENFLSSNFVLANLKNLLPSTWIVCNFLTCVNFVQW